MSNVILPQVDCGTAKEFLDALSPLGPYFQEYSPNAPWLFRGQSGDFPLIPSLFRKNGKIGSFTSRDLDAPGELRRAERDVIIRFFEMADRRGLALPDDSQKLRSTLETFMSERGERFVSEGYSDWNISDHAASLMALAQHYGIPTRLLDWSRLPYFAAYFASEGCASESGSSEEDGLMVVWAVYFPLLGRHDAVDKMDDPIRIVTAPSASTPNLKAQQGVFTLVSTSKLGIEEDVSFDEALAKLSAENPNESSRARSVLGCKLRKFTLPKSEASRLLCLLAKIDITHSSVYPGYASITNDLSMQKRFQGLK